MSSSGTFEVTASSLFAACPLVSWLGAARSAAQDSAGNRASKRVAVRAARMDHSCRRWHRAQGTCTDYARSTAKFPLNPTRIRQAWIQRRCSQLSGLTGCRRAQLKVQRGDALATGIADLGHRITAADPCASILQQGVVVGIQAHVAIAVVDDQDHAVAGHPVGEHHGAVGHGRDGAAGARRSARRCWYGHRAACRHSGPAGCRTTASPGRRPSVPVPTPPQVEP